jgi:hypothetical protein
MTRYWVLVVIAAAVAVLFLVLRVRRMSKSLEADVDIPLWDADHYKQIDFWPELVETIDDTAPAVLSPAENERFRSAANDSRR